MRISTVRTWFLAFTAAYAVVSPVLYAKGDGSAADALNVDPAIEYCSYLGGSGSDWGFGIATDSEGNVFLGGNTDSRDFPATPGAAATASRGGQESFVTQLDPTGSRILYSTYVGGSRDDYGGGAVVDGPGNAWLTGNTNSVDFPVTTDAFCPSYRGPADALHGDIFIVRFAAGGGSRIVSTYFGGSGVDVQAGMAAGGDGSMVLSGTTQSNDLPVTAGAADTAYHAGDDAFAAKFGPDGGLEYSTYLGGSGEDHALLAVLDADGNAVIAGTTTSDDFPVIGTDPAPSGGTDIFVVKINASGTQLLVAVRFGGNGEDCPMDIAMDGSGNVHLAGYTKSNDFPSTFLPEGTARSGRKDVFYTVLSPAGDILRSTAFGGSGDEEANGLAVDSEGRVFLSGSTASRDFPITENATDRDFNGGNAAWERGGDAFLSILNAEGTAFSFSTYFGGRLDEYYTDVALADSGAVFITGTTSSNNLPVSVGALDRTRNGTEDLFIVRMRIPALISAVRPGRGVIPETGFRLNPNYPNPFNPSTTIRYTLDQPALVRLSVFSAAGQRVRSLVETLQPAGSYSCIWDALDDDRRPVGSGVYLVRLESPESRDHQKITLLR